jgi:predicted dehydrogenase
LKKTIALTLEDADPAIAAAKAAEVPLQVAFNAAGIRHLPRRVRPLMPAI